MDMQTVDWAMWWAKAFVVALMTLGIVKVMDIVDWWTERKVRQAAHMVQVLALPEELDAIAEHSDDRYLMHAAIMEGRVWVDCPTAAGNLMWMRRRFPDAQYRAVKIDPR